MIEIKDIKKSYGKGESENKILKGISLSIDTGCFATILGASGSGKSTLMNVISGLEAADSGSICYDGVDISAYDEKKRTTFRRDSIGYIFQQYYLLSNMNVKNNVKMGADLAHNKDYMKIIDSVGLASKAEKMPGQLSGGEQQRVAIARALAKRPRVLFLDEPTGALDEKTGRSVLDYIVKLQREEGFTMIMVTHNSNIAEMSDVIIRMNSGKVVSVDKNATRKSAYEIGW